MTTGERDFGRLPKEVIAEAGYRSVELWAWVRNVALVYYQFNEGTEKMAFEIHVQVGPDSDMKEEIRRKLAVQMKNRIH